MQIVELNVEKPLIKWNDRIGFLGKNTIVITSDNRIKFGIFMSSPYKSFELAKVAAENILSAK